MINALPTPAMTNSQREILLQLEAASISTPIVLLPDGVAPEAIDWSGFTEPPVWIQVRSGQLWSGRIRQGAGLPMQTGAAQSFAEWRIRSHDAGGGPSLTPDAMRSVISPELHVTDHGAPAAPMRQPLGTLNGQTWLIGRSPDAQITLQDPSVSREHCRVVARDGGHYVEDLGSTYGTRLDGAPLAGPTELRHGQVIQVGDSTITYQSMKDVMGMLSELESLEREPEPEPVPAPPSPLEADDGESSPAQEVKKKRKLPRTKGPDRKRARKERQPRNRIQWGTVWQRTWPILLGLVTLGVVGGVLWFVFLAQ